MSAFQFAIESADNAEFNEAPLANGEETHTVANAIAEAQDLAQEAADEDQVADKLEDEQEQAEDLAEEVEDTVAQEGALDATSARLLKVALSNIVGKAHAKKTLPATESYSGGRQAGREATRIALEGIKDTLKAFWEAIKAQFKKVYQKVKDWMVKTFSAAKKLKDRAESLQKRANDTVGTIEEKSFSFGQTKAIAVDGKYNDAGTLTSGLDTLKKIASEAYQELKKDKVDELVEDATSNVKSSFGGSGKNRAAHSFNIRGNLDTFHNGWKNIASGTVPGSVGDVKKYSDQFGDSNEITLTGTFGLPGGKAIVMSKYKNTSGALSLEDGIKAFKAAKIRLASDKYTPRDVTEGDVKTLTTSQIDKVCDNVIDIAEGVFGFEKNWKERERFIDRIEKEVEDLVKDFDQEDDADSRDQRIFRNFLTAQTSVLRASINFAANLSSYLLTTSNAYLNYAERSLGQHKSK